MVGKESDSRTDMSWNFSSSEHDLMICLQVECHEYWQALMQMEIGRRLVIVEGDKGAKIPCEYSDQEAVMCQCTSVRAGAMHAPIGWGGLYQGVRDITANLRKSIKPFPDQRKLFLKPE